MARFFYICFIFVLGVATGHSQISQTGSDFELQGVVREKESNQGLAGVAVSTNSGEYTLTNAKGEFKIKVALGQELVLEGPAMETVRHKVTSKEDLEILVVAGEKERMGISKASKRGGSASLYHSYIDSANYYKKSNIRKSIDFITQSLAQLGMGSNKEQLAIAYTTLGEVYQYHKQYDLAISSYKDALEANKTLKTSLLLGKTYVLNKEYEEAGKLLSPLEKVTKMVPFQRVELYEILGDAYVGSGDVDKAVAFYSEGLKIADKNQIAPKTIDLNSKIATAYAKDNRLQEANAYFNNSLELSSGQAPQRSVQEKEKVADFYNQKNQFGQEIQLRKKSLEDLRKIPKNEATDGLSMESDSISAQRINYKIANAYIAQDKYDEAIPYLEESIKDADVDDDLLVRKDATRKLSEVYKYKGDYTKALETYQEYVAVVDTLYVRKEQEIARAARFNRELAAKQSRISGLEQERELNQSKYSLALTEQKLVAESIKRQNWIIYSLIFGMLLMGLAAYFFYRSNKQQKLANNLLALRSLRSQMNPHFIFNALNSVNNFIAKSDERSANRYLSDFSTLMRAVLENSDEDFIPLSKELELLELYTKLEHSRFSDKFDYLILVDEGIDIDAFQIPPMLLQPYIENAIWHGLRYREDKGFLKIELKQKDKFALEISITDNGIGRKKSAALKTQNQKKQKSKGMGNIKKRIEILNDMYKDKVAVLISDLETNGSGTKVLFTIKRD
ncbi:MULTISPECIES: tetratricopeptide repeat protein [unclassified Arenibacter]|uniref:tetratricopeptide repeat protein n=1 Tax=unclassified Arenibacter TaxID=2615047 RepID=UPI000E346A18|nr:MULTISPECIES: tetratricopeptide repeat protein [unclassified Arenibacter]MCM4162722.1 sensor histidine kinase [Arenibacter sp. A80]RFT58286.1 sensor histidine kinase [Arenibacter sp. P308M17]